MIVNQRKIFIANDSAGFWQSNAKQPVDFFSNHVFKDPQTLTRNFKLVSFPITINRVATSFKKQLTDTIVLKT